MVVVTAANVPERAGAKLVFARLHQIRNWVHRLAVIWVDGGYQGQHFIRFVIDTYRWIVEPVMRKDVIKGFVLVPQRWKVERTFGSFN
jgi:transposase